MATQLDSLQISQLKALALGLQHEVRMRSDEISEALPER